jgi:hypothetical protein
LSASSDTVSDRISVSKEAKRKTIVIESGLRRKRKEMGFILFARHDQNGAFAEQSRMGQGCIHVLRLLEGAFRLWGNSSQGSLEPSLIAVTDLVGTSQPACLEWVVLLVPLVVQTSLRLGIGPGKR